MCFVHVYQNKEINFVGLEAFCVTKKWENMHLFVNVNKVYKHDCDSGLDDFVVLNNCAEC
jgi:hypothetical protein